MAIALVGTGTGGEQGGTSPITVTLTASPSANDIILVFATFNNSVSGTHPVPSITGFTSLGSSTASVWERMTCLWKVADGTEGTSLSLTYTNGADFAAVGALILSGADTAQPSNIDTTPDASSNTTASIPALTTTVDNAWDIAAVGAGGNASYNGGSSPANFSSWGSSLTERVDHAAPDNGFGDSYAAVAVATAERATAGTQAATSVTQVPTDVSSAIRLEIKPPITIALTGTVTSSITEADIVSGGKTAILTITNGTWVSDSVESPAFVTATPATTTAAPGRTGNGDITCTLPSGWKPGDFGLIVLYSDDGTGSVPTNWTEVSGSPWTDTAIVQMQAFWKFLEDGEPDPVTTISGSAAGNSLCAVVWVGRGYKKSAPIKTVGTHTTGTGTPMTATEISGTSGNTLLVLCGRGDNETSSGQTIGGSSTGVVEDADAGTDQGNDSQVSIYRKELTSTGATGAGSATTSATDPWVSVMIELDAATTTLWDDEVADLIAGFDSAQSEATGWDARRSTIVTAANCVRTSNTVATITLAADASYNITAQETITVTVPASMIDGNQAAGIVASPTFTIDTAGAAATSLLPVYVPTRATRALLRR